MYIISTIHFHFYLLFHTTTLDLNFITAFLIHLLFRRLATAVSYFAFLRQGALKTEWYERGAPENGYSGNR